MFKKDLLKLLEPLSDDAPIWIGHDAGEGYVPVESVFQCNSIDVPLDGDEVGDDEHEYAEEGITPKGKEHWLKIYFSYNTDEYYNDVIIIGDRESKQEAESAREKRVNPPKPKVSQKEKDPKKALKEYNQLMGR